MGRNRARVQPFLKWMSLVVLLSLRSTPSQPAIHDPRQPQSTFEASQIRRDLTEWMARPAPGDPRAVSSTVLEDALAGWPREARFELFPRDGREVGSHKVMQKLPFGAMMMAVAERNHLDALLLAAVVEAESQFIPDAISPGGAVGLMQLLPSTGKDYGVRDLLDPFANLDAGSRYLCDLVSRFGGKLDLAVAAYNAGPEVVVRYGRVPPYRETQDFVRRVMERYQVHQRQAALGTRSASLLERSTPPLPSEREPGEAAREARGR